MGYDAALADRIRTILTGEPGLTERGMFGGRGFMLDGHMAAAASSTGGLLLRIDPSRAGELVDGDLVRRYEMGGRAMAGWLDVRAERVATDEALREWVGHGVSYVRSLPPKG